MLEKSKEGLSRRKFVGSCAVAAGTFAASGIIGVGGFAGKAQADVTGAGSLPWGYPEAGLDPNVVGKTAYDSFPNGHCMYASAVGLLFSLQNALGEGNPYLTIPDKMFVYGRGGVNAWGTLCGSLNGAIAVINLAAYELTCNGFAWTKIIDELIGWYTEQPLPSRDYDEYSAYDDQVQTISKSPLCHVSATMWAKEAGVKISDKSRSERCRKLSADVAKQTAILLNQFIVHKTFNPTFQLSEEFLEFAECLGCHNGGFITPANSNSDNEQGKMNCTVCHDDNHKRRNGLHKKRD